LERHEGKKEGHWHYHKNGVKERGRGASGSQTNNGKKKGKTKWVNEATYPRNKKAGK